MRMKNPIRFIEEKKKKVRVRNIFLFQPRDEGKEMLIVLLCKGMLSKK
jgi:hypothetical protein